MGFEVGIAPADRIRDVRQVQRERKRVQLGPILDHAGCLAHFAGQVMVFWGVTLALVITNFISV